MMARRRTCGVGCAGLGLHNVPRCGLAHCSPHLHISSTQDLDTAVLGAAKRYAVGKDVRLLLRQEVLRLKPDQANVVNATTR
jgi:hypothetical protein